MRGRWLARRERPVFLITGALLLIPIWSAHWIPTQDGPSHLYNARILSDLLWSDSSWFSDYYRTNLSLRSLPNWFSHIALAGLMRVFSPLLAEKVLLSALALAFVAATRALASSVDRGQSWVAFLALPFFYSWAFQKGFFNFCFSIAPFSFALAYWIRHRADLVPTRSLWLCLLVLSCYFMHVLSTLVLLASLGFLWLLSIRERTPRANTLHVAALAPAAVLILWFLTSGELGSGALALPSTTSLSARVRFLVTQGFLHAYATPTIMIASGLSLITLVTAIVATLRVEYVRLGSLGRLVRRADPLLFTSCALLVGYMIVPSAAAGGSHINERLPIYVFLILLPWISNRLSPRVRDGLIAASMATTLLQVSAITVRYQQHQPVIAEALAGRASVAAETTLLPLVFDPTLDRDGERGFGLRHIHAYYCLEAPCVSLGNYEATLDYFPIRFRNEYALPPLDTLESRDIDLDPSEYVDRVDQVLVWAMPCNWRHREELEHHYRSLVSRGRMTLYERIPGSAVRSEERER